MLYKVKAFRKPEGITESVMDAPSEADATRLAEAQGLRIISLAPSHALPTLKRGGQRSFPLVLFSQELATLLRAGLSLVDSIESLAEKEESASNRRLLQDLTRHLYEGKSLSQALSQFSSVFPDLYVALIQSSEKTGELADALIRYVTYRTQVEQVKKKIVSASIYPALLLLVGGGVMLFLVGYVVPRFSQVYEDMGNNLPWLSQVLMGWGKFLQAHQLLVLAGFLLLVTGGVLSVRGPRFRALFGRLLETIPAVRTRVFLYQLSRFYRSLGMLLRGGIPILTGIAMVRGLLSETMRLKLDSVSARIREGNSLSAAMESNGLTTPVARRMLRAGEKSGNVGDMLERTADFYDEELARWVDWFVKLFEPILMAIIGIVIGMVVILMYIPIFELASSIQ
jgi:general secretion pathway protein F